MKEYAISYRKGRADDLEEIFAFVQAAVVKMNEEKIFQWDEIYPDMTDFALAVENGELYVAEISVAGEKEKRLAATYTLNTQYDEEYKTAAWSKPEKSFYILHRIVVNPEFQHRGLGNTVMQHIEEQCRENGIESIRLDVFSQNPYSLRLYEKRGFVKTGDADWRKGRFYLMEKVL